ncbi:MAG: M3 family metallopeptidase, partial [Calditrichia bacterium]
QKSSQAMSFALRIPQDIHLVMNPQGGWVDLETLFHEMGHVLSHTFTSRQLSPPEKDFFTSNALSETYAFLLQNITFSPPFLERQLELSPREIDAITFYKTLKDLSVFRRYAGKFPEKLEWKIRIPNTSRWARLIGDIPFLRGCLRNKIRLIPLSFMPIINLNPVARQK